MIAPVLGRNRSRVFLASKSDSRDYDGFKRDLDRSLQVLQTNYVDLYQLHDLGPQDLTNLGAIEAGAGFFTAGRLLIGEGEATR